MNRAAQSGGVVASVRNEPGVIGICRSRMVDCPLGEGALALIGLASRRKVTSRCPLTSQIEP
jgi:hypothetical protein